MFAGTYRAVLLARRVYHNCRAMRHDRASCLCSLVPGFTMCLGPAAFRLRQLCGAHTARSEGARNESIGNIDPF
jgi:hypothetical protein